MIYHRTIPIEFNHCDPAGIVFYPRYLEMTNSVVENFFNDVAGQSFAAMMAAREGVPTAKLEVAFHAPSRLGERLDWRLAVTRLGRSSLVLRIEGWAAEPRLTVNLTVVRVGPEGRPIAWEPAMRARLVAFMEADDA